MMTCENDECEKAASSLVLHRPSQEMVANGAWEVHPLCGFGTHLARSLAGSISDFDPAATVLVILNSEAFDDKAMYGVDRMLPL